MSASIPPTTATTTTTNTVRDPSPAPANPQQAQRPYAPSPQQQYLNMVQRRMLQANREMSQAYVNQNQRGRAQMGMRGIGDPSPHAHSQSPAPDSRSRRASPAPGQTIYQDTIGPNGQTYRMETTIRTMTGSGVMSPVDIQNMLQGADASQAALTMTNAMNNAVNNPLRRSASSASLHNRPLTQPGVTTPIMFGAGSRAPSGRTTPTNGLRGLVNGGVPSAQRHPQEVYILSSPEGPRALLINNTTSETYYTPRLSSSRSMPRMHIPGVPMVPQDYYGSHATGAQYQAIPQVVQQRAPFSPGQDQAQAQQQQAPEQQANAQPQGQDLGAAQIAQNLGHPHIAPPVAIPPLMRMILPHLWLLVRLAVFVYIFVAPGASWSRWISTIGLAFFIFLLSTGILNGVTEHIMGPIGRHLDHILPALDGNRRRNNEQQPANQQNPRGEGTNQEPQPAQLAARLTEQQRRRDGWLAGHFRRVERASLLFLASIAPGVAERHIAHIEAEERRQREAEEAAAQAAAEAEAAATAAAEEAKANNEKTDEASERQGHGQEDAASQEQTKSPKESQRDGQSGTSQPEAEHRQDGGQPISA